MRKVLIYIVLGAALAAAIAPVMAQQPSPPAGGVLVPQAVLQACAADGGCIIISAKALRMREMAAAMAALVDAPRPEQGCGRVAPGVAS